MANRDNPCGFKVHKCDLPAIPTGEGILKNGVTITADGDGADAVILGTDGYLDIALATSTSILGIAQYTATGDGSTKVRYTKAIPGVEFEGQCSGTMAQTNIGQACDIEGTTGIMEINENASSTGVVLPIALKGDSAVGANARLVFVFKGQMVL